MTYETLVAVYDTPGHADAAVSALKTAGFAESDISVFDEARLKAGRSTLAAGVKEPGLWQRLFGTSVYEHEADIYGETVEDGGAVISVRVPPTEVAHARAVLDIHRPVDVHDRAVTMGAAPAAHVEAIEKKLDRHPPSRGSTGRRFFQARRGAAGRSQACRGTVGGRQADG
jgi:hypothetical protein